jgi:hypothetical protein
MFHCEPFGHGCRGAAKIATLAAAIAMKPRAPALSSVQPTHHAQAAEFATAKANARLDNASLPLTVRFNSRVSLDAVWTSCLYTASWILFHRGNSKLWHLGFSGSQVHLHVQRHMIKIFKMCWALSLLTMRTCSASHIACQCAADNRVQRQKEGGKLPTREGPVQRGRSLPGD